MPGGIYLIQTGGELVEMKEQKYRAEDVLQELLAKYPNLLAGDQMDSNAPRRWLLVAREMPLPSEQEGSDRWSIDHLFLDQDAIPTVVEVKRSQDTRIRREVVGQMLDYAANAVAYWPIEAIRARFEARCTSENIDPAQEFLRCFDAETEAESFWQKAKTNLQAGRIRLVFVADEVPPELRRVVEFLNKQMNPAEVLAVEIRQYVGDKLRTLVPRVIGQNPKAPPPPPPRKWDEPSFFRELQARGADGEVAAARHLFLWAKSNAPNIWWGKGAKDGSFYPLLDHKATGRYLFGVRTGYTAGYIQIPFRDMKAQGPPFDTDANRLELRRRLNDIPGVSIPEDGIAKYPSIPLSVLADESALERFLKVFDWVVQEIKSS